MFRTLFVLIYNLMDPQLIGEIQQALPSHESIEYPIQLGCRLPVGLAGRDLVLASLF